MNEEKSEKFHGSRDTLRGDGVLLPALMKKLPVAGESYGGSLKIEVQHDAFTKLDMGSMPRRRGAKGIHWKLKTPAVDHGRGFWKFLVLCSLLAATRLSFILHR